jgi:hypothetical protein
MANNVPVTPGSGVTLKTTDNAGVHTPHHNVDSLPTLPAGTNNIGKTTLQVGGVDVANANPVPVSDAGGSLTVDGTVAVSGTVTVGSHAVTNAGTFAVQESGAALTALQLIDDPVGTTGAVVPAKAMLAGGSDGTNSRAIAVTSAGLVKVDDGGGSISVDDGGSSLTVDGTVSVSGTVVVSDGAGSLTVDGAVSLSAALPAGTNNIGDVDVLTLPNVTLAAGTNTNEVVGDVAHDAPSAGNPLLMGGFASAAAPADVSTDGDAVRAWLLRNGATAAALTAAGALIGGDAANGLDVDVTRLPALPAGNNNIGDVDIVTLPALPAGANTIGNVGVVSLPSLPTGNNNIGDVDIASMPALAAGTNVIGKVDVSSVLPGTTATSLGKAEDAAHTSGDVGVLAMGVRRDADTSPVDTDGDYHAPMFTNLGYLKVSIKEGAGSGGTAAQDSATFTPTTTSYTPIGGERDDVSPATLAEGQGGAARITTNRALHVNLRDASGNELSVGGGAQFAEDTVALDGDLLTMAGVVRRDTASSGVSADGDRANLSISSSGRLWTSATLDTALPTGTNSIGRVTPQVGGIDVATGNPMPISDAGGSVTVDGTVSISGTVTVGSHAVTNAGTFAVQESGAALTSLQLIDDPVATLAAAVPTKGMQVSGTDGTNARAIAVTTTGLVKVDDGGGSITVDGTVAISGTVPVSVAAAIPAGTNNIGDVDVLTLPALPAGTNNIGDVDVLTLPAIPAGTNNIGKITPQVGGSDVSSTNRLPVISAGCITVAPTPGTQTSGAYSAGDFVDGKIPLPNIVPTAGTGGLINCVKVASKSPQTTTYWVVLFNADPTNTTITDNGAGSIADGDLNKIIGIAKCDAVYNLVAGSLHQASGLGFPFKLASGTTAYACVIAVSAITQTSTSDMLLMVEVIPDG